MYAVRVCFEKFEYAKSLYEDLRNSSWDVEIVDLNTGYEIEECDIIDYDYDDGGN